MSRKSPTSRGQFPLFLQALTEQIGYSTSYGQQNRMTIIQLSARAKVAYQEAARPRQRQECGESVYKPGSVADSHSSGTHVTARLKRPTREQRGPRFAVTRTDSSPIWSCSRWGLPCRRCYQRRGALLPHLFTLTATGPADRGGLFSVALSVGSRPPGITWHLALWSPDFPR